MINFKKSVESEVPPTMSEIIDERDKLSQTLKKYKVRAAALFGMTILSSMAVLLYLNENLSGSIDMVMLNLGIFIVFIIAMTLHKVSEQKTNIKALEPYEDLEELNKFKKISAHAAAYLSQIKGRDAVLLEVNLIKELILEEGERNAAEAKKQKNRELRRKYLADK